MGKMDLGFFVTILIAIYGAGLSTILAVIEWRKGKRSLTIFMEYVPFYEKVNIRIVNSGSRPVTIINIRLNNKYLFGIQGDKNPMPVQIEDGEQVVIPLDDNDSYKLVTNQLAGKLAVIDAERNEYTKFKALEVNPRFGGYVAPYKPVKEE
jgi:hypothetical protein